MVRSLLALGGDRTAGRPNKNICNQHICKPYANMGMHIHSSNPVKQRLICSQFLPDFSATPNVVFVKAIKLSMKWRMNAQFSHCIAIADFAQFRDQISSWRSVVQQYTVHFLM